MKRSISHILALVLSLLATNGAASDEIAVKLLNRADSLYDLFQYDSAIVLGSAALQQAKGADSLSGRILHQLGLYYSAKGMYHQADSLLQQALTIRKKALGENHPDVAESLNSLASLFRVQGQYGAAEAHYRRALDIREAAFGPEHADVATSLNGLANVLWAQGRFEEAEPNYKRALAIRERVLGPEHRDVTASLNGLANLYADLGKYPEAVQLYERALGISEKVFGPDHPRTAGILHNLADCYRNLERYAEAEESLKRALTALEKVLGKDHPQVASSLNSLANVYMNQGKYEDAEPLYERALSIIESHFDPEHPDVAGQTANLGIFKMKLGKYSEAEPLLLKALRVSEKGLGPNHPSVAKNLVSCSRLYRLQNNYDAALDMAERACIIRRKNFNDNAYVLSEKDALAYTGFLLNAVDDYLSCYFESGSDNPERLYTTSNIILTSKGQVSDCIFERQKALVAESDPAVVASADEYSDVRRQIAQQYVSSAHVDDIEQYRHELDSLTDLAQELETVLIRASSSYRDRQSRRAIDCKSVTAILDDSTVLIEYVRYNFGDIATDSTEPHYLVIVFTHDGVKPIQDLGEAAAIDSVIKRYQNHFGIVAESWPDLSADQVAEFKSLNDYLYATLWHPVEQRAAGCRLVLVAPDGDLNLIALGALRDDENRYLIEKYPLHYLTAGRDIVRLQSYAELGSGLLGIGDPDFDASAVERSRALIVRTEQQAPNDQDQQVLRSLVRNNADLGSVELWPLPYTRREVTGVSRIWQQTRNQPARTYFGAAASEDNFKREAPGKRVIHCATHGFFTLTANARRAMSDGESGDVTSDVVNPLLMSGIFLSGANLYGQGADSANVEDGLLTAYEVAGMNLNGTEWVVLSACESGLGEVKTGEGVYGLRRAFHMAGARTVIVSLWPIPDKHTVSVMEQLYASSENNLALTMQQIALQQIESIRRQNLPDHPFTWGAFIAIGDWLVQK
jgi:tetratricopeptide (TPR) repeat protein